MSAGDTKVAVLTVTVPVTAQGRPSTVTKEVHFFRPPKTADDFLRATVAYSTLNIGSLQPSSWRTIPGWDFNAWYFYGPQDNNIRWNTESSEPLATANQKPVALSDAGVLSATVTSSLIPMSSPASAQSISTITSSPMAGASASAPAATETTNSTSPAPVSQEKDAKGIQNGAVAGIAIGCLLAGALIAGLVFWLCCGKRKGSRSQDYEASSTALMPQEKGFASRAIPLATGSSATSPAAVVLPLPLEDKAIASDISKISSSIKNHVQSYYYVSRVSPGLIDLADIQQMGGKQPISASALNNLLSNPTTREIALRFCIAWVACSRMRPNEDPKTSLLPIELADCARKITNEPRGTTAQDESMLAQWRVTTADLLQNSYVRQPFTASDSRNNNIQKATLTLDNILRPFADSRMDSGERKRNLEEILKRSALFAFTLFSQPSTWDFDWQVKSSATSGELCIFPALVQVSNENGQPVVPPRSFSEAVVRPMNA